MRWIAFVPVALLAACGEGEISEEERQARVAEVKRANEGVAIPVQPEKIHYPDIEKHNLYGASCAFSPEGGGMGAILLAMDDAAHMKIDGKIESFAPDKGVQKGPQIAWTRYDGRGHSINFGLGAELGEDDGTGVARYEARLTVRDPKDRIVYDASGEAQCGA